VERLEALCVAEPLSSASLSSPSAGGLCVARALKKKREEDRGGRRKGKERGWKHLSLKSLSFSLLQNDKLKAKTLKDTSRRGSRFHDEKRKKE
jgi:hypothetical protein